MNAVFQAAKLVVKKESTKETEIWGDVEDWGDCEW